MRLFSSCLVIMVTCFLGGASGQRLPKRRAVVVPPDVVLTTIANELDCPLKFDKVSLIQYVDGAGGGGEVYELSNHGGKAIRAYSLAIWSSVGTGNFIEQKVVKTGPLQPGEKAPVAGEGEEIEFVPLTAELRDRFKLKGPMKAVTVFMVVRVEFSDGSVYSNESTFAALQEYFERSSTRAIP
jgi:hypothetical protein